MKTRRLSQIFVSLAMVIALIGLMAPATLAVTPPEPTYGTAIVDGTVSEWGAATLFANLYRAGNSSNPVLAKAYLRYDCTTQTLYALVVAVPGVAILTNVNGDEHFIKVNNSTLVNANSGDDGIAPDFAWVGQVGNNAQGWEASAVLTPGVYTDLDIHTQVFDGSERQTAAVAGRSIDLTIGCLALGDLVWWDQDGVPQTDSTTDKDGIQNLVPGPEVGVANVPVYLFAGACDLANASAYSLGAGALAMTTTDANGLYRFDNLLAGSYCIVIPSSAFQAGGPLAGASASPVGQGGDPAADSNGEVNVSPEFVYATATLVDADDFTYDFGFYTSYTPTAVTLSGLTAGGAAAQPWAAFAWGALGMVFASSVVWSRRRQT